MNAPYPFTHDRLSKALEPTCHAKDIALTQRPVGDLCLPTGALVACDPLTLYQLEPFSWRLTPGTYPVLLSVAEFGTDQRVAFASIRLRQTAPVRWMAMTVDPPNAPQRYGYGVDAGTGCFMDQAAAEVLKSQMKEEAFERALIHEMRKTYRHTWSWINMQFGEANLVAFSSGSGDGFYPTFAGFDANGKVTVVVTDFIVLPLEYERQERGS